MANLSEYNQFTTKRIKQPQQSKTNSKKIIESALTKDRKSIRLKMDLPSPFAPNKHISI